MAKVSLKIVEGVIAPTQDGGLVNYHRGKDCRFDNFLGASIRHNTSDDDMVHVGGLKDDLRYGITQFQKALDELEEEFPGI